MIVSWLISACGLDRRRPGRPGVLLLSKESSHNDVVIINFLF